MGMANDVENSNAFVTFKKQANDNEKLLLQLNEEKDAFSGG